MGLYIYNRLLLLSTYRLGFPGRSLYAQLLQYYNSSCMIASKYSDIFRNLIIHGDIKLQEHKPTPEELAKRQAANHRVKNPLLWAEKNGMLTIYGSNFSIAEEKAAIATIKESNPTDIQAISASKLTLSNSFYNNALRQSQQSFLWSLIWAGVGALFIISTVTLVIVLQPTVATSVIIALLGGSGGVGSSAIAYATFQLYKQAS